MEVEEEHKPELLGVETILDSCVLAEGKRWYQVKWKPAWMSEEMLPVGVLDTFKQEKVNRDDENDGVFHISEERTLEDGVLEYLLCRGNTWESEGKLNFIDINIVYSYWSQQSGLKEIVKIEEDFGDYASKRSGSSSALETPSNDVAPSVNNAENDVVIEKATSALPVPSIKTEVNDEQPTSNDGDPTTSVGNESRIDDTEEDDDYTCAKCNSMFISGQITGKEFLLSKEKSSGYTQCMKCGEMFCSRCSVNMGELRHNGKTSLFCDKCIDNFANQSFGENHKEKHSRKSSKPNHIDMNKIPTFASGYSGSSYTRKEFCCELCGKGIDASSHEVIVTGENSFQCSHCFAKAASKSHPPNQNMATRFPYFMPVVFPPSDLVADRSKQLNGFPKPSTKHVTEQGIKVLSGNHKSHVVHKEGNFENVLEPGEIPSTIQIRNTTDSLTDGPMNYFDEEDIDVHQDDEDGKDAGTGNYKCTDCGRTFNRQYTLDTHQRIHTGEKPYVCEVCGARFRQSGTKLNHVRAVHTKERPFQCQYCGKTFSHKSSITVHIRIHTKEKPYQCKTCERCFTDRATYLKHQSIHSGVKPYHCPMCTRKFSQKSNLKRHYKNIHELGKPDTNVETSSSSTEAGVVTETASASIISAAMSKIKNMPEYLSAKEQPSSTIHHISDSPNVQIIKVEDFAEVLSDDSSKLTPDTAISIPPNTVNDIMPAMQSAVTHISASSL